jgi:hypothetical protein
MLCEEANDLFNSLNVSNERNIPQKHRFDACFNCGDPDHGIPTCLKPIYQNWIDKAKAKFSKNGGGCGGRGGRGGGGCSAGQGRGDAGNQTNTCGKWKGDDANVSTALTTNGGIGKHNGKWSMVCKSCGWNTTHTTGFHDKWVADPKSFSLPATHLSGPNQGRILLRERAVGLRPPQQQLNQPRLVSLLIEHQAHVLGRVLRSTRLIPMTGNLLPSLLISKGLYTSRTLLV